MIAKLKELVRAAMVHIERLVHLDTAYILKGSFWLTIGQIAATGTGFLIATAFANFVPPEVYGNYKYILSLVSIISIFTLPGLNTAVASAVAKGAEGSYLRSVYKKIHWGFLGSMVSFGVAAYYYFIESHNGLALAFVITGIFLPFMDSVGLYNTFLQSKKMFRESILYFVTSQLLATLCIILAIVFTKRLNTILLTYFAVWTAVRIFFFLKTLKKFPPNSITDPATESFGNHLTVTALFSNLTTYLDSLLLFHFLGPIQVAIYNIAVSPPEQIKGLSKNIPSLALPKLSLRSIPEINAVLTKRLWWLFLIGLLSSLVYFFIAPPLFAIFFRTYHESLWYSQLFAFSLMLRLPLTFLTTTVQSKLTEQRTRWLYFGVIPQIILVVSLFAFTARYGISGTILSRYLYFAVGLIVTIMQWHFLTTQHDEQNLYNSK